jgi:hypothetical protein
MIFQRQSRPIKRAIADLSEKRAIFGDGSSEVTSAIQRLALAYQDADMFDQSIDMWSELVRAQRQRLSDDAHEVTAALDRLANAHFGAGNYVEAEVIQRELVERLRAHRLTDCAIV